MTEKRNKETVSCNQKALLTPSLLVFKITANIIKTAVSVKMVPPTVMATACCDTIPHRLTMGYEIKVWVENILATRKLA